MKNALHHIKETTLNFLRSRFKRIQGINDANSEMLQLSGINDFFLTEQDFQLFLELLEPRPRVAETTSRREYGDFQTPSNLSKTVCDVLLSYGISPEVLIEPTFGKGSFILSALKTFPTLRQVYGLEIYESYCWHTKFSILEFFIDNPNFNRPSIYLYLEDVFKFDFRKLVETTNKWESLPDRWQAGIPMGQEILVLGNPPWVTNSELSALNSTNIPTKSNFKSHNGLDAITGKGNFDIGEYIILMMLNAFSDRNGCLAMLAKNSVIKNVLQDLPNTTYPISNIVALKFDAKLHFNASVDASLFRCSFGSRSTKGGSASGGKAGQDRLTCKVALLVSPQSVESEFGWVNNKFVSNIAAYQETQSFDGSSPFVWRQGVKHDCSKILELDLVKGKYKNGFDDFVDIEDDLVFPLVKSSDVQNSPLSTPRKFVIITQKKVGEDTTYIAKRLPLLNRYLSTNIKFLSERKSSIYSGKSEYAIFGIGEYSFKPYKVAISGLYKKPCFSLVQPYNGKPTMLDDTCYFLGFDDQTQAAFGLLILNSEPVQKLLRSLTFLDAKRPYTKDILMRIDILKIAEHLGFDSVRRGKLGDKLPESILQSLTREKWVEFLASCESASQAIPQYSLFEQPSTLSTDIV